MAPCAMCGKEMTTERFWGDAAYCSKECRHAAGDRSACLGWDCGCTRFAKKRRLLNMHREQMRITEEYMSSLGLEDAHDELVEEETGNTGFWLGLDTELDGLDEDSDQEDPELALRKALAKTNEALAERTSFVEAATAILEARGSAIDLERSRMQMEDFRAQLIRKQ